jgi:hypothetical protein
MFFLVIFNGGVPNETARQLRFTLVKHSFRIIQGFNSWKFYVNRNLCTSDTTSRQHIYYTLSVLYGPEKLSRYSDWIRAGRSGDRTPVGARFFAHIQTDPGAHPASFTMSTESFPGVRRTGRDADHTAHSSAEVMKGYTSIHPLGLSRPVTGLLFFKPFCVLFTKSLCMFKMVCLLVYIPNTQV